MSEDPDLSDGRIDLIPSKEGLRAAALEILEGVDEAILDSGTKIFKGQDRIWVQGVNDEAGELIEGARLDLQHEIVWEAARIHGEKVREAGERFLDPARNPLIKGD